MTREREIRNEWTTDEIDEMLDELRPMDKRPPRKEH